MDPRLIRCLGFSLLASLLLMTPLHGEEPELVGARALLAEGRLAEAAVAFREVAESTTDLEVEAKGRNNACVLFKELGDAAAALPQCRRTLELRRSGSDDLRLARALNNLALTLQSLGDFEEAAIRLGEALGVNQQQGDVASETLVRSNLGWLWIEAGHYAEAIRQLDVALELCRAHAEEPWADEQAIVVRINYGVVLEKLGAYREALDLYETLLADPGNLGTTRRATLEVNRGVMYRNLGDPVEALASFERAVSLFETQGDRLGVANAWLNIGLAHHLNLGQLDAAEGAYDRALAECSALGDLGETMRVQLHRGRLDLDLERLGRAFEAFEHSLDLALRIGSSAGRWAALDGRGRVFEARSDLERARSDFESALTVVEEVRSDLERRDLRVGYHDDKRPTYAALVRILARLGEEGGAGAEAIAAWSWVQRAKARELLDAVGGHEPLAPEALAELLEGGALLELFVGERNLFAWVATAEGGLRMFDLGPAAPQVEQARTLLGALARGEPAPDAVAALSATLLARTGVLEGEPDHLWVAADGIFRRLPFELLGTDGVQILDRLTVSYLPNTSALAQVRRRSEEGELDEVADAGPWLAALGSPELPTPRTGGQGLASPTELLVRRFALEPLPGALRELERLEEGGWGSLEVRLGGEATEAAFRRLATSPGAVLHVASHTLLDDRPGGGSAVVLTPSEGDDGLLWASELAELPVRRRLTVLSACRSALAPSEGGDALASLSGALLAAGSSAVVASLWDVDDGATAVFMEQFYHQIEHGHGAAEALRRAKLRLRDDPRWNRPELWAAFVLVGDPEALEGSLWRRATSWRWLGIFALLSLVAGWWVGRLRGNTRSDS